ncbi:DEAD/DEAH box helicase family protein [Marinobacterium maritimum]|uniref:DEAD/DEAH box helicase family protein n=1 Tax=Marinobacterium maritimum TaxID=500162 RepID=A0ABP3TDA5_9GAMM
MNEAETRAELIDPALAQAGWGVELHSYIRREYPITLGRLQGSGKRDNPKAADYVLVYRNRKLAVVEAKKRSLPDTEGVAQAKEYAERLQVRFTYSTNGAGIYEINMETGEEQYVERYPTPEELWHRTFSEENPWRDRFADVPFEDKGGYFQPRYYQDVAIENALAAIADGQQRILLTLATGTGKTAIAFQLAWKLYQSRWNLSKEPNRRPRILFLADRNILANQAFNSFSAFPEDALVRIAPDEIRKKGRVPKNGNIFFTIFQTFMSKEDGSGEPYFGDYPKDFFDFIMIDECHRGGANDESTWRGILEYFSPAVQLGLTATPKRQGNADTYAYFGKPVYTYALKDGINDGFLTPFKVKQIATTLDDYRYTSDDQVIEGQAELGKLYQEKDFNKIIEIREREAYRVKLFMDLIDQNQKTLVFCATQNHALLVRDLINQTKTSKNPNYCVRVTAEDGAIGDNFLEAFQDNEKTIPTVLTTSQKLSTGVDARNVRNIILMRPVNSMIEFKQIIGRGTRLYDGKDYFTIYDFVKAYEHFSDPAWDGEPAPCDTCGASPCECEPGPTPPPPGECEKCGQSPCICEPELCPECESTPCVCERVCKVCDQTPCICENKLKVKLSDGKVRTIQHMMITTFWDPSGKPISAGEFLENLYGQLPEFFKDEDELRALWSDPETRRKLLDNLAEKGFGTDQLNEMKLIINAQDSDLFDVLAYVAFTLDTQTRQQRVMDRKAHIYSHYDDKQRTFIEFVLDQYIKEGEEELDQSKLGPLLELKYHSVSDAAAVFGGVTQIREVFKGFQRYLYDRG